jgi:hypothetical protein
MCAEGLGEDAVVDYFKACGFILEDRRKAWGYLNTVGRPGFDLRQRQRIFPLTSSSRPALGPTQPPVQWVSGALSPGVKRGRGVMLTAHPLLVPRLRKNRSCTSSPPSTFVAFSGTSVPFCLNTVTGYRLGRPGFDTCQGSFIFSTTTSKLVTGDFSAPDWPANLSAPSLIWPSPWSGSLFEQLVIVQLIKTSPSYYGTRKFITVSARVVLSVPHGSKPQRPI